MGSILRAVERGARVEDGKLTWQPGDITGALKIGTQSNLIVFVVDASGSMAGKDRLAAVTGAVISMLRDAYQRRDKVAVIAVRGAHPQLVLPPTNSVDIAVRRLEKAATGGRTPLAEGLELAHEVIEREYRRDPARRALLVVLSDGRATTGKGTSGVRRAAQGIARTGHCGAIVIDCEQSRRVRLGLAQELAENLRAQCVRLNQLQADEVSTLIGAL